MIITFQTCTTQFKTDSTVLFIKPMKSILPNYLEDNHFLFFNSKDIINNSKVSDCAVLSEAKNIGQQINTQSTNTSQMNANSCLFLEIATEADFEFYQLHGSDANTTNNNILSELNQVEGLFHATFNMGFIVSFQNVWTTSNDPYSSTSFISTILSELINKWDNDFGGIQRDYVHYFSGKTTLQSRGTAAVGSAGRICEVPSTYAITAANVVNINIANTTAHEIAHLFDANINHLGSSCTSLMCTLNPTNGLDYRTFTFAQATINEINNWISNNAGCLDDPRVITTGPSTVCISNSTFTLQNIPSGATVSWTRSSNLFPVSGQSSPTFTVRSISPTISGTG